MTCPEQQPEMWDIEQLAELMARMQQLGVRKLDYTGPDGSHIVLQGADVASFKGTEAPAAQVAEKQLVHQLCASMHGVFYLAQSPGDSPFVTVGDVVEEGQDIGILEAMKTLTRVEAEYPCRITEILVQDAAVVEPGTPLFGVEKLDD